MRGQAETLARTWETFTPPSRPLVVTRQTGENPEDPRFEGDIVFCTIDQMLSSDRFKAEPEQISCVLHTVIMVAGRHHSAWAAGWKMEHVAKLGKVQLHPEARYAIASC